MEIPFPGFCLNAHFRDDFQVISDRILDFGICFQILYLSLIPKLLFAVPALYFLAFGPKSLSDGRSLSSGRDWRFNLKMGLVVLIGIMEISLSFPATSPSYPRSITFTFLEVIGYFLAAVVHYNHHFTTKKSSDSLLVFWLLDFTTTALLTRTYITMNLYHSDPIAFTFIVIKAVSILIIFGLELFKKNVASSGYVALESSDQSKNITPEEDANIFARLNFYWMTSLMKLGYQKVYRLLGLCPFLTVRF